MTKIRIESDSEEDRGKTFAGQEIKIVPKVKRKKRSGGGSSSSNKKTIVYIVSDAPADQGRTFAGQKILSPTEYEQIRKSSSSSVSVQQRAVNQQERTQINQQIEKEREQQRAEQRKQTLEKLQSNNAQDQLNKRIQASVGAQIREQQRNAPIQQTKSVPVKIPEKKKTAQEIRDEMNTISAPEVKEDKRTIIGKIFDYPFEKLESAATFLSDKRQAELMKPESKRNMLYTAGGGTAAFLINIPVALKQQVVDPLRTPVETAKGIKDTAVALTTSEGRSNLMRAKDDFAQRLASGDPIAASNVAAALTGPKVSASVTEATFKGAARVKKAVEFAGKTEVPRAVYDNPEVIAGKTKMPEIGSTKEIIDLYEKANRKVTTASSQKLGKVDPETGAPTSNPLKGKQQAGDTRKGALGKEDGGINVAPKGSGTSYFLRLTDDAAETKYTLNPKKIYESIKSEFQTPTITEFETKGVVAPPKKVLDTPGFQAVKQWQKEELAGTGKVAVTKRGMIGKGELPSKKFYNEKTKKVEFEKGTSEIELTIPQGQKFKQTAFDKYIVVDGKKVAIREAELIIDKADDVSRIKAERLQRADNILKKKIAQEQKYMDSSGYGATKYKSPLPELSRIGIMGSGSKSPISPKSNYGFSGPQAKSGGSFPNPASVSSSSPISPGKSPIGGSPSGGGGSSPNYPSPGPTGGGSGGGSGGSSSGGTSGGSFPGGGTPSFPNIPPIVGSPGGNKFRIPNFNRENQKKNNAAYDVYIRENGKRIKANDQPLPYNLAQRTGLNVIDNTVAASFELQKRGSTRQPDIPAFGSSEKIRMRKTKNALLFVEKSKYRIDTQGEKQGLGAAKFLRRFRL